MKVFIPFILYFSFPANCHSGAYCAFDPDVKKIYKQIIDLHFDLAIKDLGDKAETSSNKAYILLENEIDFYNLFVYDQKPEFEKKKSQKNRRIKLIEDSDLPPEWKNFLEAEILLQWALVYLKQDSELMALQSIRESMQLLEDNAAMHPEFIYTYKSLGVLHTLLSTIPQGIQWAARLIGLDGNLHSGKMELQKYIQFAEPSDDLFLDESYAAMSFVISFLENKPVSAFQYWIAKMGLREANSLHVLVHCKLAIKSGYNDAAILALQTLDDREKDNLPYLYFLAGLTWLQKLDAKSEQYFIKFLSIYKGSTYIKETYQKLAWNSLLKGDAALYHLYISNCLFKGNDIMDEDKQAKDEAMSEKTPDLNLLKARLLFDGGYCKHAYEVLQPVKEEYYSNDVKKLECAYRLGRICQMNKDTVQAIQYYSDAIQFDPQLNSYMGCNALLQSGMILESQNKKPESLKCYQKVLQTDPDEYKRSIHQKAKAGLARLNP